MMLRDVTLELEEVTVELEDDGDSVSVVTPHGIVVVYLEDGQTMVNADLHD